MKISYVDILEIRLYSILKKKCIPVIWHEKPFASCTTSVDSETNEVAVFPQKAVRLSDATWVESLFRNLLSHCQSEYEQPIKVLARRFYWNPDTSSSSWVSHLMEIILSIESNVFQTNGNVGISQSPIYADSLCSDLRGNIYKSSHGLLDMRPIRQFDRIE